MLECVSPMWDIFRAIGIMTMGNLGKAVDKGYFFLYFMFSPFSKIIGGTMLKFSGIPQV